MPKHLLIVAGDPSADLHGAALVKALRRMDNDLRVSALGGVHLRACVDSFIYPLVGVGGFGFWEPLLKIRELWSVLRRIKTLLNKDRPDVVVPMDYYGFNIHVARLAKSAAIPVVYYISPQIWASRPQRMRALSRVIDKMLVIFPFEVGLYQKAGVPVRFVGHPLLDRIPEPVASMPARLKIGFLPGSRAGTVKRHLPILVETAKRIHEEFPDADYVMFRPGELEESLYRPLLNQTPWLRLICENGYEERKSLSLAISVSGTAALENMLLGIPMIIMYRLSGLTYAVAKRLIRVPYVGIPNLLAARPIVPELLQERATADELSKTAKALLKDPAVRQQMRDSLLALRRTLRDGGSQKAAEEILQTLRSPLNEPAGVAARSIGTPSSGNRPSTVIP